MTSNLPASAILPPCVGPSVVSAPIFCEDCREPLRRGRILAIKAYKLAHRCVECQEAYDRPTIAEECAGMAVMGAVDSDLEHWQARQGL